MSPAEEKRTPATEDKDTTATQNKTEPYVDIVQYAKLPTKPRWQVRVSLSNDNLPKATVVKGKVCQKYVCINAMLIFDYPDSYTINEDAIAKDNPNGEVKKATLTDIKETLETVQKVKEGRKSKINSTSTRSISSNPACVPEKSTRVSGCSR
jgi:hypothetical protein